MIELTLKKVVGCPFKFDDLLEYYNSNFKNINNDKLIKENYKDTLHFLDDVNDKICRYFNAEIGVNWEVIHTNIENILKEL